MATLKDHKNRTVIEIENTERNVLNNIKKLDYACGYDKGLSLAQEFLDRNDEVGLKNEIDVQADKLKRLTVDEKDVNLVYPSKADTTHTLNGIITGIVDGARALKNIDLSRKHNSKGAEM